MDYTTEHNYLPLTKMPSDYFQLELSYVSNSQGVVALLHVPCTIEENLLTMYRYIPFPIPIPHQTSHSSISVAQAITLKSFNQANYCQANSTLHKNEALFLVAEADMIAIDKDHRYRLLSQSDLAGCIQRNHIYLCDKLQVMRTNVHDTCIGSLFMKDQTGVKTNCKFDRRPLREEIFQLETNEFLVFTPQPFISQADCDNGTSFRAEFGRTTRLTLPSGCTINLNSHQISVAGNIHLAAPPYVTAWKWDPLALPADLLDDPLPLDSTLANFSSSLNHSQHQINLLSSSLSCQNVHEHNLNLTMQSMGAISHVLQSVRTHNALDPNHIDNHLFYSGSKSSVTLWIILIIISLLLIASLVFIYRHIIYSKFLSSMSLAQQFLPQPSSAPQPDIEMPSQRPLLYPVANPIPILHPRV